MLVFSKIFEISKKFRFGWGALPPRPSKFWLGGESHPTHKPLNCRSSHLIEAAKRGRLDQMIFFFGAADDTGAARSSGRTSGRTPARPSRKNYLDAPVIVSGRSCMMHCSIRAAFFFRGVILDTPNRKKHMFFSVFYRGNKKKTNCLNIRFLSFPFHFLSFPFIFLSFPFISFHVLSFSFHFL